MLTENEEKRPRSGQILFGFLAVAAARCANPLYAESARDAAT